MQDPFSQVVDDSVVENSDDALMTRVSDSPMPSSSATKDSPDQSSRPQATREPLSPTDFVQAAHSKQVCPFCGAINERATSLNGNSPACPRCGMQDSLDTRQSTTTRIGPWFVRQGKNPSAPGMRFETLLALVKRGQVSPGSIVRGPTTQQLWKFAGQVKGLSREFGLCHHCGGVIETSATICPACSRMQEPPVNPDVFLENAVTPTPAAKPPAPKQAAVPQSRPQTPPAPVAPQKTAKPVVSELTGARPKAPQTLRRGEEILTARELAAAFQLDFQPADQRSEKHGWTKPRKLKRKIALVALLLIAGLVAAALVKRPDWRAQAVAWSNKSVASMKQLVAKASSDAPKPAETASESTGSKAENVTKLSESVSPENGNVTDPAPPVEDQAAQAGAQASPINPGALIAPDPANVTAATSSAATSTTTTIDDPPSIALPNPAITAESQGVRPSDNIVSSPSTGATSPTSLSGADQLDQARTLYRQAIDAEAKRDSSEAVRLYEKVKRLPREVWPGDLEIRLERARRAVK